MKRILFYPILAILFFCTIGFAKKADSPYIIDEFGKINSEDLTARLDNYFNAFEKYSSEYSEARAVIIIRLGKTDSRGFFYRHSARIKSYLTKVRKMPADKIIIAQGGDFDYLNVKLYLIPTKDNPEPNDYFDEKWKTKTSLFDSFDYTNEGIGTCCVIDDYQTEETEATLSAVSQLAKKLPESKIYLIAYGCKNRKNYGYYKSDSRKYADKFLKESKEFLSNKEIESSRITTINGGLNKYSRKTEIWLVPKGGEVPKLKPDYFPKKKRKNN